MLSTRIADLVALSVLAAGQAVLRGRRHPATVYLIGDGQRATLMVRYPWRPAWVRRFRPRPEMLSAMGPRRELPCLSNGSFIWWATERPAEKTPYTFGSEAMKPRDRPAEVVWQWQFVSQ